MPISVGGNGVYADFGEEISDAFWAMISLMRKWVSCVAGGQREKKKSRSETRRDDACDGGRHDVSIWAHTHPLCYYT
jgi:hypothetical protein